MAGFGPATPAPQTRCSDLTELHTDEEATKVWLHFLAQPQTTVVWTEWESNPLRAPLTEVSPLVGRK